METSRPDPTAYAGPCPRAPDLTAFAHGEFPEWRRAEVSRHLLRCPACRRAVEGAHDLLGRLAALGASGEAWRDDLAAAGAALRLGRRRSGIAVFAGAAAAAVLAAGVALVHAPERAATTPTLASRGDVAVAVPAVREAAAVPAPVAAPALSADERRLLAAQRPDGRWNAGEGDGAGASDEAATGLSLLALAARRPEALRQGPIARAAAAATSWLVGRRRAEAPSSGSARDVSTRDRAISAAALLEVWAATREPGLYPAVDGAVRDLARLAPAATDDAEARWSHATLARAKGLGWEHLDAPMRRIPAPLRPTPLRQATETPWPVARVAAPGDVGTLACAMRVLSPIGP